ncbi:uncharacterized protein I303_102979 [Kwoniella dejecticola CBS 10117]|uniref:Mitochondrial adapter protein MCP1 transmembrane domain-containing protein n=1 Tax=Kwoniella dejecticola CBS 10117 TaxID=1296121 RepID=A0A1A6AA93_9TREE|nr:uncharacterized protein I303_02998 [Kwoniella dejecticola CBS 10117]OBR86976.1 hypothetical protein I303_02998 [Kwoniella dejecticola CBS 10117]
MSPPPPDIPMPHELAQHENENEYSHKPSFFKIPSSAAIRMSSKGETIKFLTLTQNTSAMVFTVFLIPHLASPVVASVAGLQGADKTMMIARDLYIPLEPLLIYIPLALHTSFSILRRILLILPSSSSSTAGTKLNQGYWRSIRSRLPRQIHQIIAYPLSLMVLTHIFTHRLIPSSSQPPINSLSPSELNWEFVGYNLRSPISWISYLSLVGMATWHSVVGGMKVVSYFRGSSPLDKFERRKPNSSSDSSSNSVSTLKASLDSHSIGPDEKEDQAFQATPKLNGKTIEDPDFKATAQNRKIPKKRQMGLKALVLAVLGIVSVGLYRVKQDTGVVSPLMKIRYDAIYQA